MKFTPDFNAYRDLAVRLGPEACRPIAEFLADATLDPSNFSIGTLLTTLIYAIARLENHPVSHPTPAMPVVLYDLVYCSDRPLQERLIQVKVAYYMLMAAVHAAPAQAVLFHAATQAKAPWTLVVA